MVKFWYDCNTYYGWVTNITEFRTLLMSILAENNGLDTIDDIIDHSQGTTNDSSCCNYGLRREYTATRTLRDFLRVTGFDLNELRTTVIIID